MKTALACKSKIPLRLSQLLGGAILAGLLLAGQPLFAATDTWEGGGTDGNWQTGGNWTGVDAPPVATDALIFDGTTNLNANNNFAADTQFNGLAFSGTAGAFVLTGNNVLLGASGIVNSAATTETINLNIDYTAGFPINGGGGAGMLVLGGTLSNTSATSQIITLTGTGQMTDALATPTAGGGLAFTVSNGSWTMLDNPTSTPIDLSASGNDSNGLLSIGTTGGVATTFTFGSATSFPVLVAGGSNSIAISGLTTGGTTLTSSTNTLNIVNGTLTVPGLNVGESRGNNSVVSILNVTGGTLNVGKGKGFGLTLENESTVASNAAFMNVSGGTVDATNSAGTAGTGKIVVSQRAAGTLTISGGTVETSTIQIASGLGVDSVGILNLNGGTLLLPLSGVSLATPTSNSGGSATFNFNGGTLELSNGTGATVTPGTQSNVPYKMAVQTGGAVIKVDNNITDTFGQPLVSGSTSPDGGLTKQGIGTLALSSATLNTYTGPTTVSLGTLAVSGTLSATDGVTVTTGAQLNVNGLVDTASSLSLSGTLSGLGSVGPITAGNGSTVSPSDEGALTLGHLTAASLTLNSGANLGLQINGTSASTFDSLTTTANNALTLGGELTLNVGAGYVPTGADMLTLILDNGTGSVSGTFSGITVVDTSGTNSFGATEGSMLSLNGQEFDLSYVGGVNDNSVTLTAAVVPEPSTWAMLLGAFGMFFCLGRRRRF